MTDIGLTPEFHKFFTNVYHLRRLENDTQQSIDDISKFGNLGEDLMNSITFLPNELRELYRLLHIPLHIVVGGQTNYSKALVVTRLLGERLLPIPLPNEDSKPWRPVRFHFSMTRTSSLSVGPDNGGYEVINSPTDLEDIVDMIPDCELEVDIKSRDEGKRTALLEIGVRNACLQEGVQILVMPSSDFPSVQGTFDLTCVKFLKNYATKVLPIFIYAIARNYLTNKDGYELHHIKQLWPNTPIFFIRVPPLPKGYSNDLPETEKCALLSAAFILPHSAPTGPSKYSSSTSKLSNLPGRTPKPMRIRMPPSQKKVPLSLYYALSNNLGFLNISPTRRTYTTKDENIIVDSQLINGLEGFGTFLGFVRKILQYHLIRAATILNEVHCRCMKMFILYAFDMAREIQITPRRLNYAKEKECELYENLMAIVSSKQEEIKEIIAETLQDMKDALIEKATNYEFAVDALNQDGDTTSGREVTLCTNEIQEFIINSLNDAIGKQLVTRLSIMRESYLGTLQRCLENLEKDCRACGENSKISGALKQMVNAAYQVQIKATTSSSFLHSLWEKMKQIASVIPGRVSPVIDNEWKKKVAVDIVESLSEAKLTKNVCIQFRDHLKNSHESFLIGLRHLESKLANKLEKNEENQNHIRKVDAPKLARLSLESVCLRGVILCGMPRLDRELGRGQYGVVYGCESWGGFYPCAVKSLVPNDEKHWNDLAMEYYYTRSLPEHDRIVPVRGSVIDHTYGNGETPAVLLVMDRLKRDLYCALKGGLNFVSRLQIALDVCQGIRFLHSQGLIHRDIKLKNVLLDKFNRAKLTDLGFCKPEAMISGSIVGTPIHMAPELFSGSHYDSSIDVYAFGILFWYICAGQVRLPTIFEQYQSKDQLWNHVKKGARPERLSKFDDECWQLMQDCWDGVPSRRPLLGAIEPRLQKLLNFYSTAYKNSGASGSSQATRDSCCGVCDNDRAIM